MFTALSATLLFLSWPLMGNDIAVWLLAAAQLLLLIGQIRTRQVTGVGGFIFMYFLFMGVRPFYIYWEKDYITLLRWFSIRPELSVVTNAMWWATFGLICFSIGAQVSATLNRRWFARRRAKTQRASESRASLASGAPAFLLGVQFVSLLVMLYIAGMRRGIYGAEGGAYLYDLPMVLQAAHIVAAVLFVSDFVRSRTLPNGVALGISLLMLLSVTWLMREVSVFRGFYISGVMVFGLALLHQLKARVSYLWLILPVVALQPLFGYLGAERRLSNEELFEQNIVAEVYAEQSVADAYWNFYSSDGDMNIFDTFVGATRATPRFYPYVWSWAYVPLHIVPRAFWKGKPVKGLTMDMSFTREAPLSPGIVGFFLLDGGFAWMLFSMFALGYILSLADGLLITLAPGYVRSCLIGIFVVNGMFLSRLLLWQYFYLFLYPSIVVLGMSWFLRRAGLVGSRRTRRNADVLVTGTEHPVGAISMKHSSRL